MRTLKLWDADRAEYVFESIKTQGYLEGKSAGVHVAHGWLLDHATLLFRAGKDTEAAALRELARRMVVEIQPLLQKEAIDHEKDYHDDIHGKPAADGNEEEDEDGSRFFRFRE